MFQLEPAPPKMELNDYILLYKSANNFEHIRFFLHRYENKPNYDVAKDCKDYGQKANFDDIKLITVTTLLEILPRYRPGTGVMFIKFAKPYVNAEIQKFIRKYGSFYSVVNDNHYRELKRATAIFYDRHDLSVNERIAEIVRQTGKSKQTVSDLLAEGESFKFYQSIYTDCKDDFGDEYFEDRIADEYSNPQNLVPSFLLYDDMITAIENQMHRSQAILLRRLGISCLYCGQTGSPTAKEEIANHFELYSDSAVDRALNKAITATAKYLTAQGWFYAMQIKQESTTKKNGKIISAIYSYRPMFGEDKGELEFDLTKPAENNYIIDKFTVWDRKYPFFRRLVKEVAKMQAVGKFDKEKLLVWWP